MNSLILLLLTVVTLIEAQFFLPDNDRYCNSPYCSTGKTILEHVNCNNTHELQCDIDEPETPKGPYDGHIYNLTAADKKTIVDLHNKYRNIIACGKVKPYPSAAQMKKLTWDDQLAEAALLNVNECDYGHDCHNTETYPHSGQNIDLQFTTGVFTDPLDITLRTIREWYDEHKNTNESIIKNYKKKAAGKAEYAHFAEMVSDRNTKIGCAILQYKSKEYGLIWDHIYSVCNYDTSNMEDWTVYDDGATGADCPHSVDKKYKCLCSDKEK